MDGYGTFRQYVITHRQDFDALLFDVDGTLSYGGRALSGAKELLEYLNKNRVPYLLMTNDAGNSPEQKAAILNRAGIPVSGAQVLSAGLRKAMTTAVLTEALFSATVLTFSRTALVLISRVTAGTISKTKSKTVLFPV